MHIIQVHRLTDDKTNAKLLRLVVITSLINCVLGFEVPTFFQLVLGGLTMFNFLRKEKISMSKTITKAVGAGAVGPSESSQLRWLV